MSDKCPEWSNGQRCESCGAWCIDKCVRCGAPQCCPQCCSINTERAARETHVCGLSGFGQSGDKCQACEADRE